MVVVVCFQVYKSAELTLRCSTNLIKSIGTQLTTRQRERFKKTIFGPWLNVLFIENDAAYVNLMLQKKKKRRSSRVEIQEEHDDLWFGLSRSLTVRFGRREFCLMTGLRFGELTSMNHYVPAEVRQTTPPIRVRCFQENVGEDTLTYGHIKARFLNTRGLETADDDLVRLAIIIVIEMGMMGKQPHYKIDNTFLHFIEDFNNIAQYP
ncbi:uncharacterized protein [Rutidosis leptorrhynchoides]|uniref:uncharacterized protein n=1 Tax=Rutidosis leptorrhynchoides TaxID=125765 RepID=UPI003A9A4E82